MSTADDSPAPPDAILVQQRWIPVRYRDWALECDSYMKEWGIVRSKRAYERYDTAKRRVHKLRNLMIELRMHEPWQLITHVERSKDGYVWFLEYKGDNDGVIQAKHPAAR